MMLGEVVLEQSEGAYLTRSEYRSRLLAPSSPPTLLVLLGPCSLCFTDKDAKGHELPVTAQPEGSESGSGLGPLILVCSLSHCAFTKAHPWEPLSRKQGICRAGYLGAPELTAHSAGIGALHVKDGGNCFVVALERRAGVWGHRKCSPEEQGQWEDCMLGNRVGWNKVLPKGRLIEASSRTFIHYSLSTSGGWVRDLKLYNVGGALAPHHLHQCCLQSHPKSK